MKSDIVVVDDMMETRNPYSKNIRRHGYNPLTFNTATECIEHLKGIDRNNFPIGYFVDMKIPGDLDGPENLHNYLAQLGMLRNFYFMTGNLSEHDQEVKIRTGATVLMKGDIRLGDILDEIINQSQPPSTD